MFLHIKTAKHQRSILMKKPYGKIKMILIAILSSVLVLSCLFAAAAFAETGDAPADPDGVVGKEWTATVDGITFKIVDTTGAIPQDTQLSVTAVPYQTAYFAEWLQNNNKNVDSAVVGAWTIKFGDLTDVEGQFQVTISGEPVAGISADDLLVVHVHHGKTLLDATVSEGAISFTTTGFSDIVVLSQSGATEVDTWWIWLLLALVIVLNLVIILLLLLRQKDDEHGDEETVSETAATTATETCETEENVSQEVVEPDEEETELVLPQTEGARTVLNRSFAARLSQADDGIKVAYSELKNALLSYKKIRSRLSWKCESFYKGRSKCALLQIRGKKLYLYAAIAVEGLPAKFHAKDVSARKRFARTPALVKISGKRSLLYAKQLVDLLMSNLGAEKGAVQNVNYKPRRKATQTLIDEGLIKITFVKGGIFAPANQAAATQAESSEEVVTPEAPAEESAPAESVSDKADND